MFQVGQLLADGFAHIVHHGFVIAVGAAQGLGDDLVDQLEALQSLGRDAEGLCGIGGFFGGFPQNGSAAFGRNHGIGGVLQHVHGIAHGNGQRTAGAAFANYGADNRHA